MDILEADLLGEGYISCYRTLSTPEKLIRASRLYSVASGSVALNTRESKFIIYDVWVHRLVLNLLKTRNH